MNRLKVLWILTVTLLFQVSCVLHAQNTAIVPEPKTPIIWEARWNEKRERLRKGDIDLIFVGDSITQAWDKPENYPVWSAYYEPRRAVNLGYSGARTENILWMLENGGIDGIHPKVAVVMIGTNNTDSKRGRIAHTGEQLAEGIVKIVHTLRAKLPDTKVLLLKIFPRADFPGASQRGSDASDIAATIADNKHIFYLDINPVFLQKDGTVDSSLLPDLLHPNPIGNLKWAEAMEPTLRKLMGKPENSAVVPVIKCEQDFYDWSERHEAVKAQFKKQAVDLIFVGDSITHMFGGVPTSNRVLGGDLWEKHFAPRNAVNLGFGWDRTQQVVWRLQNGELEGIHPKVAVVLIGTNNIAPHNARGNTNEETVEGIKAVCAAIRQKSPRTKVLLLGILPRDQQANTLHRHRIQQINAELRKLNGKHGITFLDFGSRFLQPDGAMLPNITTDFLHPNEQGYRIWIEAMEPVLSKLLGEKRR
ncbi:acetylhydrolase [Armatimonadota bacterium]|nr:acetylhydrolase [Armatimonadota bacterium]